MQDKESAPKNPAVTLKPGIGSAGMKMSTQLHVERGVRSGLAAQSLACRKPDSFRKEVATC